ncbi:hypothetical protein THIOM_001132 [Candidatus Thiomargarita nelsonii]|uniref:Uncharacterized protein n=1 Tax=Candidatus Thiomargarita nelsonii TaxID=1003181 RepID=A0A176S4P7_9GAMM|nr:hypothetical protein THIOM_001132 [Candidatus Thiomargarita nelsonii]
MSFCLARILNKSTISFKNSGKRKSFGLNSNLSASILDKSKISLININKCVPLR